MKSIEETFKYVTEMLKHNEERHCLKVNIIKYIKKYGKEEVQEILDNLKQG